MLAQTLRCWSRSSARPMYLPQRWAAARKGGLFQQGAPRTRVPVLSAACPQGWPRLSGVAVFAVSALLVWIWADLPSGGTPWTQTGEEIDVVGVAVKPTCVSKRAVESLNTYLRPRRIIIVTTSAEACTVFVTFAKNVQCVEEGSILPGVSKETVGEYLEARYKSVDENSEFHGRLLAGWYLQQFLKLGAAEYMPVEPELSQYFLVWDLDMMLLRPLSLFYIPGASRKVHHVQRQTVVNVGGNKLPGYEPSYKRLTGQDLEYAPDGTSFVTHWLVVYKPYMAEFLISIGGGNFTDNPANALHLQMGEASTRWVWRILDSIDPKFVETGFSEYASYVSWVKQNYPESQHVLKRRTWRRNPLGGKLAIIAGMYFRSDGLCCPMEWAVRLMRFFNYQYVGFEIGHYHVCGYTDERHDKGYGV